MQLTIASVPPGTTAADYVRAMAARGMTPQSAQDVRIHGYNAVLATYLLPGQQGAPLAALVGFIEFQNRILQIVGVTPDYRRFASTMEASIRSFDKLSDQRILRVQPDRLKIYTAQQGDTLTTLARRANNPRVTADELAILNRLAIDQPITPGRLLKTVEKGY
jgi:predicted Zn-dependent protease